MEERSSVKATLLGVAGGGGLFLLAGIYLNVRSGSSPFANAGPLLAFTVIGLTVGGLTGPLLAGILTTLLGKGGGDGPGGG